MIPFTFTFTIDSAGSPDDIVLPANFPTDRCTIRLKPPTGHAWTFTSVNGVAFVLDMDEVLTLQLGYHTSGQTIGAGALDAGSGTGSGVAS